MDEQDWNNFGADSSNNDSGNTADSTADTSSDFGGGENPFNSDPAATDNSAAFPSADNSFASSQSDFGDPGFASNQSGFGDPAFGGNQQEGFWNPETGAIAGAVAGGALGLGAAALVNQHAGQVSGETVQSETSSLNWRLSNLRSTLAMADISQDLGQLDAELGGMAGRIGRLRARGYAFKNYLEGQAQQLANQWGMLRNQVQQQVSTASPNLQMRGNQVEQMLGQVNMYANQPGYGANMLAQCQQQVQALESEAQATQQSIRGGYQQLKVAADQLSAQVTRVEAMLDGMAAASFQIFVNEGPIDAAPGHFLTDGKKGLQGVLFVTDQRLIFEERETVVKERKLFFLTKNEQVQKVLLNIPIGAVVQAAKVSGGWLGGGDHLELRLRPPAPMQQAFFKLDNDQDQEFAVLIGSAASGEIGRERAGAAGVQVPPTAATSAPQAAAVPQAPGQPSVVNLRCPTCGAAITQPVVRGMLNVTCRFCATVIKI